VNSFVACKSRIVIRELRKDQAMKLSNILAAVVVLFGAFGCASGKASGKAGMSPVPPPPAQNLMLAAPVKNWDEAIPLGNGLTGGLLFGGGSEIHLGLDRGDLWDERTYGPKEWWKTQTWAKGGYMWEEAYHGPCPTKLPAGRVEIELAPGQKVTEFELNYATAEGVAKLDSGQSVRAFFSAGEPIALMRIPGAAPKNIEVLSPLEVSKRERGGSAGPDSHSVNALSYPEATTGSNGNARWYVQTAAEGLKYCGCIETKRVGDETLVAVALTTTKDATDLVALARQRCAAALAEGYGAALAPHVAWWKAFWAQSSVSVPESAIQNYYVFARYLYGAGSRRGAPPMPLQGVWSASNGSLPPWHGDYHGDLNTQMTYMGYQTAGLFDEGACYLDYLWNLAPFFRSFAKEFYGTDGLATPGVMSLAGQPLGGWGAYSLSPTMSAWNAHLFYLHWRYTMDDAFLRDRAYPWCSDAGHCMAGLLKPDNNGVLKLLRSSSPEIYGNTYLEPNTNYDLMCLKMLFLSLQEMADALDKPAEAQRWLKLAAGLGDYHAAKDGELMLDSKRVLRESHRHPANLMGIYPFNLITCEGSAQDKQRIAATLARPEWHNRSHFEWCGYTWGWMSCMHSRVGDAEAAYHHLDVFVKAYISRNGFHVNQDQSRLGFGAGGGRPFTLEGNFLAMQAVQEMLLQSWSPTPGQRDTEVIRIFPAMPWHWHEASFNNLHAEGGYCVSARRENNATAWLRVIAGKDGVARIRDNFNGAAVRWNRPGVTKAGDNFEIALKAGQAVEATLAVPSQVPPAPADAAQPIVIAEASGISQTTLPLRIGAASNGSAGFIGEIARPLVYDRALTEEEIAALTNPAAQAPAKGCVVALDLDARSGSMIPNRAMPNLAAKVVGNVEFKPATAAFAARSLALDGKSWLEIANDPVLGGDKGLTLAAWVKPAGSPAYGQRILDKCPAGVAAGWRLDTHPSNSLRLFGNGEMSFPAKLPAGQWTHVAATVDGKTGGQTLYINGKMVAQQ
jgi:alpha-L-fucosidase 2